MKPVNDEDGFTIIEVLIAAFILVLGALAVFMTFAAGIHNIERSRETQVGVSVAQREVEKAKVEDWGALAMSATPTYSTKTKMPGNRLFPAAGAPTSLDVERGSSTRQLPLVVSTTLGKVKPGPELVASPDGTKVNVYRYVVCEIESAGACLAKRIVVDVLPEEAKDLGGYVHPYYELQSTATSPTP